MTSTITPVRGFMAAALLAALLIGPTIASAASLTRQLQFGMSGSDVSTLQAFLAENTSVYPEGLVTGYFGSLTRAAVLKFQANNNIDMVGRVGPITMAAINAQMMGGVVQTGDVTVPSIFNINVNTARTSANITWATNEPTKGTVYFGTSPLSEYETPHAVTIGGTPVSTDASLRSTQNITISDLTPNTTYYYDIYVTDAAGNASMTMQTTFKTTN